jgi:ABC-type Fe3+-hydroxamate transport system substrate-binding protein
MAGSAPTLPDPAVPRHAAAMAAPQRIVSLVPSTTESVCALGAGERIVGCTRYCTEPAVGLAHAMRLGGTKNPSLERIARLRPDLVLVNAEENRGADIAWLRERFPLLEQTPCTVLAAAAALRELAVALDRLEDAEPLLLRIEAQLAAAAVATLDKAPLRVFYAVWRKPWMGVNGSTFVHDVLRIAGGENVCAGADARYPQVDPAAVVEGGVDVVLLPSEPWEFDEAQRCEIAAAGTFGDARLRLCDGRDFCWHGARIADGIGRAAALLGELRSGG